MVMKSVLLQADTINCNLIKRFQSQKSKICTLHEALDRKNCVCVTLQMASIKWMNVFTLALKIAFTKGGQIVHVIETIIQMQWISDLHFFSRFFIHSLSAHFTHSQLIFYIIRIIFHFRLIFRWEHLKALNTWNATKSCKKSSSPRRTKPNAKFTKMK